MGRLHIVKFSVAMLFFFTVFHFETSKASVDFSVKLITNQNRVYPTMFGGWGPQLRGLMRNLKGELWIAVDRGPSVEVNSHVDYYQLQGSSWQLRSSLQILEGVQQNLAHILSGNRMIYSYGISRKARGIQECYFDTLNPSYKACNFLTVNNKQLRINPQTDNYIGAAIAPDSGMRLVTWASVGPNGSGGHYNYVFNDGGVSQPRSGRWQGPIRSHLSGYGHLGYLYGQLLDSSRFVGGGQMFVGVYPTGNYQATAVDIVLGQAHALSPIWSSPAEYNSGIRMDSVEDSLSVGNGQHILARSLKGPFAYVYRQAGAQKAVTQYFDGIFRGRLHLNKEYLTLILGSISKNEVYIRRVSAALANQEVNWKLVPVETVKLGDAASFGGVSGIYVEGPQTQSQAPVGLNFAVTGGASQPDLTIGGKQIFHVSDEQK